LAFYRYFCNGCGSSLLTCEFLVDPVKVQSWFNSICPSCKTDLSDNVKWRRVGSDDSISENPPLIDFSSFKPHLSVNFRRLSEIQSEPRLYFGDEKFDRFLGGLSLGHTVFLYGSWQSLAVSELLCVRTQLNLRCGGLNSEAIFLDGGNTFDPYLIAQYAGQLLLDRNHVLDQIFVSRAFTCHQLTSFITKMLPEVVHTRRAKLIIVSDVVGLYRDPTLHYPQSLQLFKTAINSLVTTARFERLIVLTTCLKERTLDSDPFLRTVKQSVDIVLRFEERRHSTKLTLEKHPILSGENLLVKHPTPKVLEAFLNAS